MTAVYLRLNTDTFAGFARDTVVLTDDTHRQVKSLITSGLGVVVGNPGGTPPTYAPNTPRVAFGAQAVSAAVGAAGAGDKGGSVTATALATAMAAGVICTVTYSKPRTAAPKAIILTDQSAGAAVGLRVSASTTAGFTISSRSAATASQVLAFDFAVID
jgi:hypothetical protein